MWTRMTLPPKMSMSVHKMSGMVSNSACVTEAQCLSSERTHPKSDPGLVLICECCETHPS